MAQLVPWFNRVHRSGLFWVGFILPLNSGHNHLSSYDSLPSIYTQDNTSKLSCGFSDVLTCESTNDDATQIHHQQWWFLQRTSDDLCQKNPPTPPRVYTKGLFIINVVDMAPPVGSESVPNTNHWISRINGLNNPENRWFIIKSDQYRILIIHAHTATLPVLYDLLQIYGSLCPSYDKIPLVAFPFKIGHSRV